MLRNIVFSGNSLLKRVNVSALPSRFIRSRKPMTFERINTKRYALFKQYIDYNKMITEQLNKARADNIKLLALIEKTQGPNCETLMRPIPPTQPIPQNSVKKTSKDETSLPDVISMISMGLLIIMVGLAFPPFIFAFIIVVLLL